MRTDVPIPRLPDPRAGSLADDLLSRSQLLLDVQLRHPFVTGIADGSLTTARFQRWLVQSWKLKEAWTRSLAWATARAPDRETMAYYARLLTFKVDEELPLHQEYASRFGVSAAALDSTPALPTTRAWCDFLVTVAAQGDLVEILATHLPWSWDQSEIGRHLVQEYGAPGGPYLEWIRTWSDPACKASAQSLKEELDWFAGSLSLARQKRLADIFLTARRYEVKFWEMCWSGETWPGKG